MCGLLEAESSGAADGTQWAPPVSYGPAVYTIEVLAGIGEMIIHSTTPSCRTTSILVAFFSHLSRPITRTERVSGSARIPRSAAPRNCALKDRPP